MRTDSPFVKNAVAGDGSRVRLEAGCAWHGVWPGRGATGGLSHPVVRDRQPPGGHVQDHRVRLVERAWIRSASKCPSEDNELTAVLGLATGRLAGGTVLNWGLTVRS